MTRLQSSLRGFALTAALTLPILGAWAVPAKPGIHHYNLPDGSSINVSIVGDEFHHYYVSEDGYALLAAADGSLRYVVADSRGKISLSDICASNISKRSAAEKSFIGNIDRTKVMSAIEARNIDTRKRARNKQNIPSTLISNYPTIGKPKSIILLVQFQDVKFSIENPKQAFEDLAKKPGYDANGGTGSALDFFRDNSNNLFEPQFEVFGPVTLPHNEPHYGAETASAYDTQGWMMAYDGVKAMREAYPDLDFSDYDNDGDGFVDNIFIFYAGYGQNEGAPGWTIWPHSAELWNMYNLDLTYDGVKIDKYACTNELNGTTGKNMTGIGTFVHEYSHILGLMDHYPTKLSNRSMSPGSWDVMDMGSYNNEGRTPPAFNSFERYCLKWLNPRRLTGPENVVLNPIDSHNEAVLIQTEKDEEFFLLENRQKQGWDSALPGHGMLIWHVDYDAELWDNNNVNNEASHQRFDLVEADGVYGDDSRPGDAFPGPGNVRNFTAESNPPMKTWINSDPNMPVTDIAEIDGKITFRVKGGGDALEIPQVLEASNVTPTSFTANWQLVAGLSRYEIDVCEGDSKTPFISEVVTNATSFNVGGLNPSTLYYYIVRSSDGERTSYNSEAMTVTTLAPTLDMLTPEAKPARNVSENSFVASWNPMDLASGYLLNIYTKRFIDPEVETADFTDGIVLPDGWQTTGTTTGSLKGYYGESAPAIRLMYDDERIVTAEYPGGINSLSFWYRGNSTDDDASLSVESFVNGKWIKLAGFQPLSKKEGVLVTIGKEDSSIQMPDGTKQLRIVFHRGNAGSLYLDDIVLEHDASFEPIYVGNYERFDCGNNLEYLVTDLEAETQYFYTITAYNNENIESMPSKEVAVFTSNPSEVKEFKTDFNVVAYNIHKGSVEVTANNSEITLSDMTGTMLHREKLAEKATTTITAPAGIYILTIGTTPHKIVIP